MVGLIGQANHAAYVATKGGMISLTRAMALDYAPLGIRVNAICPAGVWTPLLRQWLSEQADPQRVKDDLNKPTLRLEYRKMQSDAIEKALRAGLYRGRKVFSWIKEAL